VDPLLVQPAALQEVPKIAARGVRKAIVPLNTSDPVLCLGPAYAPAPWRRGLMEEAPPFCRRGEVPIEQQPEALSGAACSLARKHVDLVSGPQHQSPHAGCAIEQLGAMRPGIVAEQGWISSNLLDSARGSTMPPPHTLAWAGIAHFQHWPL